MSVARLREALRNQKLVFGSRQTLHLLKQGKVKTVFLSRDCRDWVKKSIHYYASLGKVDVVQMDQGSRDIAQLCKKNFPVSVLSHS